MHAASFQDSRWESAQPQPQFWQVPEKQVENFEAGWCCGNETGQARPGSKNQGCAGWLLALNDIILSCAVINPYWCGHRLTWGDLHKRDSPMIVILPTCRILCVHYNDTTQRGLRGIFQIAFLKTRVPKHPQTTTLPVAVTSFPP